MSSKRFCDGCGDEITRSGASVLTGQSGTVSGTVYVTARISAAQNGDKGDWCDHCIIDAVKAMDDRPVAGTPARSNP